MDIVVLIIFLIILIILLISLIYFNKDKNNNVTEEINVDATDNVAILETEKNINSAIEKKDKISWPDATSNSRLDSPFDIDKESLEKLISDLTDKLNIISSQYTELEEVELILENIIKTINNKKTKAAIEKDSFEDIKILMNKINEGKDLTESKLNTEKILERLVKIKKKLLKEILKSKHDYEYLAKNGDGLLFEVDFEKEKKELKNNLIILDKKFKKYQKLEIKIFEQLSEDEKYEKN